jgi:hypothetical protein
MLLRLVSTTAVLLACLAGCDARTAKAEPALTGKAALITGSWRCETDAASVLAGDIGSPVHKYDATYPPEGDVRISGTVTGTLGARPVAMGYMARAKWTLEKDTLDLDYSIQAATSLTVEKEPLDHSMLNKDFIDATTREPSLNSAKLTVGELTDKSLVLTDARGARATCKRV